MDGPEVRRARRAASISADAEPLALEGASNANPSCLRAAERRFRIQGDHVAHASPMSPVGETAVRYQAAPADAVAGVARVRADTAPGHEGAPVHARLARSHVARVSVPSHGSVHPTHAVSTGISSVGPAPASPQNRPTPHGVPTGNGFGLPGTPAPATQIWLMHGPLGHVPGIDEFRAAAVTIADERLAVGRPQRQTNVACRLARARALILGAGSGTAESQVARFPAAIDSPGGPTAPLTQSLSAWQLIIAKVDPSPAYCLPHRQSDASGRGPPFAAAAVLILPASTDTPTGAKMREECSMAKQQARRKRRKFTRSPRPKRYVSAGLATGASRRLHRDPRRMGVPGRPVDLCSRRVVGWAMSKTNDTSLALEALHRAVRSRAGVPPGLVHHTDRGSPYASDDYRKALSSTRWSRA